MEYRIGL